MKSQFVESGLAQHSSDTVLVTTKRLICAVTVLIALPSTRLVNAQGLLYIVNTSSDTVVAGACANGNAGCSLRGAIQEANVHVGDDGIEIDLPADSVIHLTSALPDLTESVSISGAGRIPPEVLRDTGGNYRIFNVTTTGTVFISGLTIRNGLVTDDLGGGIQNVFNATVTITNCLLIDNQAEGSGSGIFGGGINNAGTGTVNVTASTLSNNSANGGGGINNNSTGTVNVTGSGISGNSAVDSFGGAIANASSGTVNVTNSTFISFNTGGGIYNKDGTVNVTDCSINGNFGIALTTPLTPVR